MKSIWQDLRYGLRVLRKSPGLTACAVFAIALGVGANTAIFSVVNTILLRPLSYEKPERLVMVWEKSAKRGGEIPTSLPNFIDLRDSARSLEGLGAFIDANFNLSGGTEPERVAGMRVTAPLFSLLGAKPVVGRLFQPDEDQPQAARVVLISHGLWQRRFGADPQVVGRTVSLDGEVYTVVGVMPETFKFPPQFSATIVSSQLIMGRADLWVPLTTEAMPMAREVRGLFMLGRLGPGVEPHGAEAELNVIAGRLRQQYPDTNADTGVRVIPLQTQVSADVRPALFILFGVVGCVLLIACANVANLLLARAAARRKEVALRSALGATRWRIVRQLLTESVLLGLAGGLLGLLLAAVCVRQLGALAPPSLARFHDVTIDGRVLAFTLLLSLLSSLAFGLAPALQATSADIGEALKESGRSGTGGARQRRLRGLLVVVEIALTLVLLIASGLMLKSFLRLQQVDPGFDPKNLLTLEIQLPPNGYGQKQQQIAFEQQLVQRVASLPGVRQAGAVDNLPFSSTQANAGFTVEGREVLDASQRPRAFHRAVSPTYFQAMGLPLLRGRPFAESDSADAPHVAVINEAAARLFWPGEDSIGKRFKRGRPEAKNPWLTVVGVVGDASHTSLELGAQPEVYFPFPQSPGPTVTLVARTVSDPRAIAPSVRREVSALDSGLPVSNIRYMSDILSESVAQPRLYLLLIACFAALALTLAVIGVYGVMSYTVVQRAHEIGVRIALGAQPRDIIRLIVGQGLAFALTAIAIGLAASFALTRVMASLLYGVSATDAVVFTTIPVLLACVTLLACYLPARRATKGDPLAVMRSQ
jgi:putative ABC transport system permease protein